LAATGCDAFWCPALSARPVSPPNPRIVAPAAIRVFMFFTTDDLLAEVSAGLSEPPL
jgi:hypothetical protein